MRARVDVLAAGTTVPELASSPGHLLWRAAARVGQALAAALPEGVDLHAYATLLALSGGVARSQQDLARSAGVSRTTMVRVAADLAGAGLVERVRNPADRRSYALTRTEAGARAAQAWRHHAEDLEDRLTTGFSGAERRDLRRLLLQVVEDDLDPATPADLRSSVGFLVTRAHAHLHRAFAAGLAPVGVEPRHHGALIALHALGPVPQHELAHALGVTGASVVQLVDDLEERGVVARRRAEGDRRTQLLSLLPAAAGVMAESHRVAGAVQADQLRSLTPAEVDRLVALLGRFVVAR